MVQQRKRSEEGSISIDFSEDRRYPKGIGRTILGTAGTNTYRKQQGSAARIIMRLAPNDIQEIRLMFEDFLRRSRSLDRIEKMKMRARIRSELSHIAVLENPKVENILYRWEEQLSDLFSMVPFWFKEDLKALLAKKIRKKKVKPKV